jgi:hypothetical protein
MTVERKFRGLVDTLPETMTCGRRVENGMHLADSPFHEAGPDRDHWEKFKSNGDRVCSYCGSLHPDDFFRLVKLAAEAPEDAQDCVSIDPSDKGYKIYVRQPGVQNAHDGGIKFYKQHLDSKPTDEQRADYKEAVRRSVIRFEAAMKIRFPPTSKGEQ